MTLWFISDTHFSHTNTWAKFTMPDGSMMRPFSSNEEMDELMVQRWNEVVRPSDHIYHLGDVAMCRPRLDPVAHLLTRLNGHKRLVLGNHDVCPVEEYLRHFEKIFASRVLEGMIFTHIPIHPGSMGRFKANVHGHVHSNPAPPSEGGRVYVNVSVEVTAYRPVSMEELKAAVELAASAASVPQSATAAGGSDGV
jgi:calcineurin-like phosphoesterase family protein